MSRSGHLTVPPPIPGACLRITDAFVADHMERWARRQYARSALAPTPIQGELPLGPDDRLPRDPWERAIAQARAEIRALIEEGQLSHDEISEPWIAQWAADIFQAEPLESTEDSR